MQNSKLYKNVIIFESACVARNSDIHIIHEEKVNINDKRADKIFFRTKLQEAEQQNGNNRWYSKNIINEIVNGLSPKAKNRSLFMEVDHPFVSSNGPNDDSFKKRAVITELKNSGSLIRNIYVDGKDVIAEVETLSGFRGPDLRNLIVEDKANIGFSLRMFGRLKPHATLEGVNEVTMPLKAITYDVVSNPSHSSARILNFLTESLDFDDSEYVSEGLDDLIIENDVCLPGTCKEECSNYLMKLIDESFSNIKNIKFNI
jgi:hypothetical protein